MIEGYETFELLPFTGDGVANDNEYESLVLGATATGYPLIELDYALSMFFSLPLDLAQPAAVRSWLFWPYLLPDCCDIYELVTKGDFSI